MIICNVFRVTLIQWASLKILTGSDYVIPHGKEGFKFSQSYRTNWANNIGGSLIDMMGGGGKLDWSG
jgi:hypothetical protein